MIELSKFFFLLFFTVVVVINLITYVYAVKNQSTGWHTIATNILNTLWGMVMGWHMLQATIDGLGR